MLAEINLLPRRERRNIASYVIGGILLAMLLVGGMWFYLTMQQMKEDVRTMEKELLIAKTEVLQAQKDRADTTSLQASAKLEQAVKDAEKQHIKMVPVMAKVTSFLPERGMVQEFSYAETGIFTIQIQFDQRRDAAYFYKRLMDETWVKNVKLSVIEARDVADGKGNSLGLPRYLASYEVTVNKEKVRKLEKETEQ